MDLKPASWWIRLKDEVTIPFHTTSVTLYPDMVLTPDYVAFYASNAFDHSSHKLIMFDHGLALQSEKLVNGLSHLYSGQVATHNTDLFVAHVYSGDLDFDGELALPHQARGRSPYIAKVTVMPTGIERFNGHSQAFLAFPNPASDHITLSLTDEPAAGTCVTVNNLEGQTLVKRMLTNRETGLSIAHLSAGIYLVTIIGADGHISTQKLVKSGR